MSGTEAAEVSNEYPAQAIHSSVFRGVVFTGAGTAVSIVALLLETMVAARLLDTDSYGLYVLLTVVVSFLVMAIDCGCKTAVTKLIAGSGRIRQAALAHSALVFRLLAIAVLSALIWLWRDSLLLLDPSRSLLQYAAYVPVMVAVASLDELLLAALQGFQLYRHMAVAHILRSVLRLFLSTVLLVALDFGAVGLVYSWIISFAVSAAYQYVVLPVRKGLLCRRSLLSEILRFGLALQGNRLLWFVSGRIDILLLGTLFGPSGVAHYNVAAKIPTALMHLAQSYVDVYFPTVAALLAEGKRTRARWIIDHSLRLTSFAMALAALSAVLFSKQIVTLLFSDKYAASSWAFSLLMMALHMTVLVNLMGYTLTSAGRPGRSLAVNIIRTAVVILADLALIPVLGFTGPAYASLISYYAANPLCVRFLQRNGILVDIYPYAKQTAMLWLCAALFWWAQPTAFVYKAVIIALFLVLNVALSTVSVDDLRIVLPEAVTKRMGVRREALSDGR